MDNIKKDSLYKDFNNKIYEILHIAINSETNRRYIIYKNINNNKIWATPIEIFTSKVENENGELIDKFKYLCEKENVQS